MLLEAEKSLDYLDNNHVLLMEEIEQQLDQYTKMQLDEWKIKTKHMTGSIVLCFQAFCKIITKKCNRLMMF